MQTLKQLKQELTDLVPSGIDIIVQRLKQLIPPFSPRYQELILIEGRFQELLKKIMEGTISQNDITLETNQIRTSILKFIQQLAEGDFEVRAASAAPSAYQTGQILYRIPNTMKAQVESDCRVRVAWDTETLTYDWESQEGDTTKELRRVSEVMRVELIDPSKSNPFRIRTFSEATQFVDKDDYTEWRYVVTPQQAGAFPLILKVSVIEMKHGKERKREIILEEHIQVITEEIPAESQEGPFKQANEPLHFSLPYRVSEPGGKTILIEIMATDQEEFAALIRQMNIRLSEEGEISGLDGMALLAFSVNIHARNRYRIMELLKVWLEQRKSIQIKSETGMIETDSPQEFERIAEVIN